MATRGIGRKGEGKSITLIDIMNEFACEGTGFCEQPRYVAGGGT